jgi:hypothetical protein
MTNTTKRGGSRANAGRKKGTIKGRKIVRQIQVELDTFNKLNILKKQNKSKSWSVFFSDLIESLRIV